MQEAYLERWEELADKVAPGLYSFNGRDLSVELEELHEHVTRVERELIIEVVQLSWSVMEISDAWSTSVCSRFKTSLRIRSQLRMP
jgi:hypothetical protein